MSGAGDRLGAPRTVAVIVSTYNQPEHLERCLHALRHQRHQDFDLLIADDGSAAPTRAVIEAQAPGFGGRLRHVWQPDDGFRKTWILNRAILSTDAEYLVFMDGDCVAHPDFIAEHLRRARRGHYLNGARIRLTADQTAAVTSDNIASGEVFGTRWLVRAGGRWDRRYLKLSLPRRLRGWLNRHSLTALYWLGANSSCFRNDAVAVNGFDNRFTYGYEDGDFGNRLTNYGVRVETVRWTANVLHLDHERPYYDAEQERRNQSMQVRVEEGGVFRTPDGLEQVAADGVTSAGL